MISNPDWWAPRKFGWGLGVKRWQGLAYVLVVAFIYGALFASPLDAMIKVGAAVIFTGLIIIDLLQAMVSVYSHLDEREEKHQLMAERNASFTAIAIITVYILYQVMQAAAIRSAPDPWMLALPAAILVAMALAKGGTLLILEREG